MPRILRVGLPDRYVTHGKPALLHAEVGFTGKAIAAAHRGRDRDRHGRARQRVSAGLHPQVRALLERAAGAGEPAPPDLQAERAAYLQTALELGGPVEPVARVEDVVIPDVEGGRLRGPRLLADGARRAARASLVWLHGGGWYVGDLECFDRVTRQLANASGAVCVSVDYRLAPEHRYPAAVDDARARSRWAAGHGAASSAPTRRAWSSAATAPAATSPRWRRATSAALVRAQLLVYPALDAAMDSDSYREFAEGPMLAADDMARCWDLYLGGADRADPDASPLAARDLARLAARVHRRRRPRRPARRRPALRAGAARGRCRVTLDRYDDMVHGFLRWGGVVDRARELIEALGDYARAALGVIACRTSSIAIARIAVSTMYQGHRPMTLSSEECSGLRRRYM